MEDTVAQQFTNSTVQHFITKNTKDGKSTYHELPNQPKVIPFPFGTVTYNYANPAIFPDLSADATGDLEYTAVHSQGPPPNGRLCPDGGMQSGILTLKPNFPVPMHRTRTIDIGIILEGEIEMYLDNDEVRTLRAGDTFIQRGTAHRWLNKTEKDVKMFAIAIDAKAIMDGHGNELKEGRV